MRKPFVPRVGGVLSTDIAVPDHPQELEFYSKILTTGDTPHWRNDLMNNVGEPIIGLGIRTPEYESLPLQWMPHFQVADVAASVAGAIDLGGKELWHAKTDDGQSQWAVLTDQFGAAFGVIPVVDAESFPAEKSDRLGCVSWLSLNVPEASTSRDFYQRVVGWDAKSIEKENGNGSIAGFEMLIDDEIAAAEICQHRGQPGEQKGIPSVWLIHLPVGDLAESLRLVTEGGGEVVEECSKAKYAVVRDPVGVYLALRAG